MTFGSNDHRSNVPQHARTVLLKAAERLHRGRIHPREYQSEIDHLIASELRPHGLTLVVRDLGHGAIRFLIRSSATWEVCETIDYTPE